MQDLARMMNRVDAMNMKIVIYELLQGIVLLGLIFRLIMYLSFQKRLSVIGGTLVSSVDVNWMGVGGLLRLDWSTPTSQSRLVPELFNFLIVVVTLCCMFAMYACICFGPRVEVVSTFADSIFAMLKLFALGDDSHLYDVSGMADHPRLFSATYFMPSLAAPYLHPLSHLICSSCHRTPLI